VLDAPESFDSVPGRVEKIFFVKKYKSFDGIRVYELEG